MNVVKRGEVYPIAEEDKAKAPAVSGAVKTAARWTGERRAPKAGEWYLSGAVVEAYRAPNDLSSEFHIARLVAGRVVWDE